MYTTMPIIIACLEILSPHPVILILIFAMPWANKIHVLYGLHSMGG